MAYADAGAGAAASSRAGLGIPPGRAGRHLAAAIGIMLNRRPALSAG
jgi:hypothetical protein